MESRLAVSLGRVADREMKHPGEEASGHQGTSGEEASRMIGIRAPRRIGRGGIQGERYPSTKAHRERRHPG